MKDLRSLRPALTGAALLALASTVSLAGCGDSGGQDPQRTYPSGAVRLRQNIPTPVGDQRLVASGILDSGKATVTLLEGPGAPAGVRVSEGETAEIGGVSYQILDVDPGSADLDREDLPSGFVVVLPAG
ncbi:MAG: hypothetical protein GXX79_14725 [Actinomycetales bacterium]|nr:hypothetical protein [Actinomycetales bacterium]